MCAIFAGESAQFYSGIDRGYAELWILVDESGGRVTSSFDPSVLPDSIIPTPGPRRYRAQRTAPAFPRARAALGACDSWQVVYYNSDANNGAGGYDAVPGVLATGTIYDYYGNPVGSINSTADATGAFYVCTNYQESYSGQVSLVNSDVNIQDPAYAAYFGGGESDGSSYQTTASGVAARVFTNMRLTVPSSRSLFSKSRPVIGVKVGSGYQTEYKTSEDRIYINSTNAVWGGYGIFSSAHEYGHAFQNNALGGFGSFSCPNPHYIDGASGLGCALVEGFADFHAVIVRADSLKIDDFSDYGAERDVNYAGTGDGSVVEGAVASFFYDLLDNASTPDGSNNQSDGDDDTVAYPGSYIADIVKTCFVNGTTKANGIDHIIYCFERTIDPAITGSPTYFPTRSPDPTSYSEGATEPPSWSQSNIRALWLRNLYGQ